MFWYWKSSKAPLDAVMAVRGQDPLGRHHGTLPQDPEGAREHLGGLEDFSLLHDKKAHCCNQDKFETISC